MLLRKISRLPTAGRFFRAWRHRASRRWICTKLKELNRCRSALRFSRHMGMLAHAEGGADSERQSLGSLTNTTTTRNEKSTNTTIDIATQRYLPIAVHCATTMNSTRKLPVAKLRWR
jgi:hypothetical protein